MSDSLSRTLILLQHLSAAKAEGVTVTQLVERTQLASSTVYRLVQELEALGYLRKAGDRRLFPKFLFEQGRDVGGIDIGRHVTSRNLKPERVRPAMGITCVPVDPPSPLKRPTIGQPTPRSSPEFSMYIRSSRSGRRFFDTECQNQGVSKTDIQAQCRWSVERATGGRVVHRDMVECYSEFRQMKPTLLRPSQAL